MKNLLAVVVLSLCVSACGNDDRPTAPSTPSTASVSGTWTGTTTSAIATGSVRVTLAQTGTALSGSWGSTYSDPSFNNSGTLTGNVAGRSLSATLQPSIPTTCPTAVTATVSSTRISGTWATVNCTVAMSGGIDLIKQ